MFFVFVSPHVSRCSCDYLDSLPGVGLITAQKYIKKHRIVPDDNRGVRTLRYMHFKSTTMDVVLLGLFASALLTPSLPHPPLSKHTGSPWLRGALLPC